MFSRPSCPIRVVTIFYDKTIVASKLQVRISVFVKKQVSYFSLYVYKSLLPRLDVEL